jgi:hypothetical protein
MVIWLIFHFLEMRLCSGYTGIALAAIHTVLIVVPTRRRATMQVPAFAADGFLLIQFLLKNEIVTGIV